LQTLRRKKLKNRVIIDECDKKIQFTNSMQSCEQIPTPRRTAEKRRRKKKDEEVVEHREEGLQQGGVVRRFDQSETSTLPLLSRHQAASFHSRKISYFGQ
jgi:hypothetical protein